jgi:hypothetical protein
MPAVAGVVGLVTLIRGDRESGNGKDEELRRGSRDCKSRREGRGLISVCGDLVEVEDSGRSKEAARTALGRTPFVVLDDELAILLSLALRDRVVLGVVVWLRAIFCCVWLPSDITSPVDCGFLACEIAKGPAHFGKKGTATLASTKLARTDTGSTFSLIFSCLVGSATPNTICCTLLYILLQVLKASDWGFWDRSCK